MSMDTFTLSAGSTRVRRASLGITTGVLVQGVFPGPIRVAGHIESVRQALDIGNFDVPLGWARLPHLVTGLVPGYHSFKVELARLPNNASSMLAEEIIQAFPNRLTLSQFLLLLAQRPQLQTVNPLVTYWVDQYPQLVVGVAGLTTNSVSTGRRSLYIGHGRAYCPRGSEFRVPVRIAP